MPRTLDEIRDDALALPLEERSWLAHDLWESLRTPEEREIDEAWEAEIERRVAEHEAGRSSTIPMEEVFRALRATSRRVR